MYQRARKLATLRSGNAQLFVSLGELQLEAYTVSINALSLVDSRCSWIVLPLPADPGNEVSACFVYAFIILIISNDQ